MESLKRIKQKGEGTCHTVAIILCGRVDTTGYGAQND
jgi:hypothetical protein